MQYAVTEIQNKLIMDLFYTQTNNSSKEIAHNLGLKIGLVDHCITKNLNKKYEEFNKRKTEESSGKDDGLYQLDGENYSKRTNNE